MTHVEFDIHTWVLWLFVAAALVQTIANLVACVSQFRKTSAKRYEYRLRKELRKKMKRAS